MGGARARSLGGASAAVVVGLVLAGCGRSQLGPYRDAGDRGDSPDGPPPSCRVDSDCGNRCMGGGVCVAGQCMPLPLDCNDDVDCTVDMCDPVAGCTHQANDLACPPGATCDPTRGCLINMTCRVDTDCDDGISCNGVERCVAGQCVAGTPRDCSDGVACTDDACDLAADRCVSVPNAAHCPFGEICDPTAGCLPPGTCTTNAQCDDGFFCDGMETCQGGVCTAAQALPCDDGVGCTYDRCSETARTCDHIPVDALCDDGVYCNGVDRCDPVAGCGPATMLPCDDGNACTTDSCDEASRTCSHTPIPPDVDGDGYPSIACGGTDCDDTNPAVHPGVAESCTNGIDDNCNGLVDCADTDCDGDPACPCRTYENCNNGADDNCNGAIDCNDAACVGAAACLYDGETCAVARNVSGGAIINGDTSIFGNDYAGSCGTTIGPDRVFYFILRVPSRLHADTVGSSYDTVLYLRAPSCTLGPEILCDDNGAGGGQASLDVARLDPGTYYLFLDGAVGGRFLLTISITAL